MKLEFVRVVKVMNNDDDDDYGHDRNRDRPNFDYECDVRGVLGGGGVGLNSP